MLVLPLFEVKYCKEKGVSRKRGGSDISHLSLVC